MLDIRPGIDAPLWLLQKDDTRFLYFSFLLSVTVHIILFVVMAATRIFHPLSGASREFDLVWFSPTPVSSPIESAAIKTTVARRKSIIKAHAAPVKVSKPAAATKAKTETQAPPPAEPITSATSSPPKTVPVAAQVEPPKEAPTEEPVEMVISRYDGKVVDVVDNKADVPTFTVISSVKMKNTSARAVVQTIRESISKTKKSLKPTPKKEPTEAAVVKKSPTAPPTEKPAGAVAAVPAPARVASSDQAVAQRKPVQSKISSASAAAAIKPTPLQPVNRSINSFSAALAALSATKSEPAAQGQVSQKQKNGTTHTETTATVQTPPTQKPSTPPVTVEKPAPPEAKPASQTPPSPPMIFQPPVIGDLKLVITGDFDAKVEISFRPFPKARRAKPFTRREAENSHSVIPIMVQTKEKVHEAAVEVTEEGIYIIKLRPANGKQSNVQLLLKIHESRPGAVIKNLGSRKIDGAIEVAKILMPEGILWKDESYFTGDMEDADSITKFNSDTGLMWREFK